MAGRLAGKVMLISGGARGQGAVEGKLFAREGAKIVVGDILDGEGQQIASEITAAAGEAVYVHLDVTKESDWKRAVETAVHTFGKLNVLVNNAGILYMEGLEDTTLDIWHKVVAVNQIGVGGALAYQATKGAVRLMTKSAAVQYAKEHIRINSIHPGLITTLMVTQGIDLESRKGFEQATPMGREGTVEEVANGALFLASDESSYMTGAELVLDGGYTAQ